MQCVRCSTGTGLRCHGTHEQFGIDATADLLDHTGRQRRELGQHFHFGSHLECHGLHILLTCLLDGLLEGTSHSDLIDFADVSVAVE